MGLNGTDVAREAADLVLLDDNFASIVVGIKEGRLLFNNLKKSILYTLTHLIPEILPVFLWFFTGAPLAIGAIPVIMFDLWTEMLPAIALAFEKEEYGIMQVPPRNVATDKLTSTPLLLYVYLQAGMVEAGVNLLFYFIVFQDFGISPQEVITMNNEFFPSPTGETYINQNGREYDAKQQEDILGTIQGTWYMGM